MGIKPTLFFQDTRINERDLEEAWSAYVTNPTDKTASIVYNIVPMYDSYIDEKKLRIWQKMEMTVDTLEKHLLTGSRNAIDLAFKLHSISTGGLSLYLIYIEGPFIHINPSVFLWSLKEHIHLVPWRKVLRNCGPQTVDRVDLQNLEMEKRIASLASVSDISLLKLRDQCIDLLEDEFL